MPPGRKRILISFQYNEDTGQIERFVVDDQNRLASEDEHDQVARAVAAAFLRHPLTEDDGADAPVSTLRQTEAAQQQQTLEQSDGPGPE